MRFRALLAAVLATGALVTSVGTAAADDKPAPSTASTIAVIGDTPYGDPALARFPSDVAKINGDPDVSLVAHLGDIKNGSSVCSDSYFSQIRSIFDTFQDPLVYTPGDNEWTDCHRASAGGFLPTERLDKIRQDFFPVPGQTLGVNKTQVQSQNNGSHPYVENTMFSQSGVVFSAVNLPGSNNDLVPWFGVTPLTEGQQREFENRQEADLEWIDKAFENARENKAKGVALMLQADMWDATALPPAGDGLNGYDAIVQRIGKLSAKFRKPVLMLEGDSHNYRVDHPFTSSDPLYNMHPLGGLQAPNVTRVVVDGSSNANDYLKLTIDPASPGVFTWTRVNF